MKLLEHQAKSHLRAAGLPVPSGTVVHRLVEVRDVAAALGGRVAVKALVAAGRRGKAGGVRIASNASEAQSAADAIFDSEVAGLRVRSVYVESAVNIERELYLSFSFGPIAPQMIVCFEGGVDVERLGETSPEAMVRREIDPLRGLAAWQAADAWEEAGAPSALIPDLAKISVALYAAFVAADGVMLEVNPLALTHDGSFAVVGAMLEVDDNALFRHVEWETNGEDELMVGGRLMNARERAVQLANRTLPGASVRYTELDGNIGLMVSGGGAGLFQHDMMLAAGGAPSCHTDMSPTPTPEKPAALIEAIIRNPKAEGLLIGFNYLQLAPCDRIAQSLLLALERCQIDTAGFPVVLRLLGPGEDEARRLLANRPGIDYLPADSTLEDGVRAIVAAVASRNVSARGRREAI